MTGATDLIEEGQTEAVLKKGNTFVSELKRVLPKINCSLIIVKLFIRSYSHGKD